VSLNANFISERMMQLKFSQLVNFIIFFLSRVNHSTVLHHPILMAVCWCGGDVVQLLVTRADVDFL